MTTKDSPLSQLRQQGDMIAAMLKKAERGEPIPVAFGEKIAQARGRPELKLGIVMDDQVITLDLPWTTVKELSEPELSRWIVSTMRGKRADG